MLSEWLTDPIYRLNRYNLTAGGLIAFAACATVGFALSGFLQSNLTTRLLGKIGLDQRFFAVVRFVLSLFFLIGLLLLGLNLTGVGVPWEQRIPGLNVSMAQILRLIFVVCLVLWLSSVIKQQIISRILSRSGLEKSLQYAIAQARASASPASSVCRARACRRLSGRVSPLPGGPY